MYKHSLLLDSGPKPQHRLYRIINELDRLAIQLDEEIGVDMSPDPQYREVVETAAMEVIDAIEILESAATRLEMVSELDYPTEASLQKVSFIDDLKPQYQVYRIINELDVLADFLNSEMEWTDDETELLLLDTITTRLDDALDNLEDIADYLGYSDISWEY